MAGMARSIKLIILTTDHW